MYFSLPDRQCICVVVTRSTLSLGIGALLMLVFIAGCLPIDMCSEDAICNDGSDCTLDTCEPDGFCSFALACAEDHCIEDQCVECITGSECVDDDLCTINTCTNNVCIFASVDCDDQDACTEDVCDPTTGTCTHELTAPFDCDDQIFCNGQEVLEGCECVAGDPPCGPTIGECDSCDEASQTCAGRCSIDQDCDDAVFCNGVETCDGCLCQAGEPPCGPPQGECDSCDEASHACGGGCSKDEDCDDGIFCNGVETCDGCLCYAGDSPCGIIGRGGSVCDETSRNCGDPCLAQCESGAGACAEQPIEGFGDFQSTLDEWMERYELLMAPEHEDEEQPYIISGNCQDASLSFLTVNLGFTSMTRFFETSSSQFVGLHITTDGTYSTCNGIFYWPGRTNCGLANVTEVYDGTSFVVGDTLQFFYPEPN